MQHTRHKPEDSALHKLVREHLPSFLARALEETGKPMPAFIVEAWRKYLSCGLGGAGFRRRQCEDCGFEEILCFSCKVRAGPCCSCCARQLAEGDLARASSGGTVDVPPGTGLPVASLAEPHQTLQSPLTERRGPAAANRGPRGSSSAMPGGLTRRSI